MTFQTLENNEVNRGQQNKTDLENEIRSTWLGMSPSTGTPYVVISFCSDRS